MFKKVLIVDDIDFNDIAAVQVLNDLEVPQIEYSKYCDDALLKLKKAHLENHPYELLISDLSFKADHRENKLNSGEELIAAVKKLYPEIKIIVFSIEDRAFRIKSLFEELNINGYVMKGRTSIYDLKNAIEKAYRNEEKNISQELMHLLHDKAVIEIDKYDIELIRHLSFGVPQESMEATFKEKGITPNSKSTIEKRIAKLKDYFKANNPAHLVSIAKDLGII